MCLDALLWILVMQKLDLRAGQKPVAQTQTFVKKKGQKEEKTLDNVDTALVERTGLMSSSSFGPQKALLV